MQHPCSLSLVIDLLLFLFIMLKVTRRYRNSVLAGQRERAVEPLDDGLNAVISPDAAALALVCFSMRLALAVILLKKPFILGGTETGDGSGMFPMPGAATTSDGSGMCAA